MVNDANASPTYMLVDITSFSGHKVGDVMEIYGVLEESALNCSR